MLAGGCWFHAAWGAGGSQDEDDKLGPGESVSERDRCASREVGHVRGQEWRENVRLGCSWQVIGKQMMPK